MTKRNSVTTEPARSRSAPPALWIPAAFAVVALAFAHGAAGEPNVETDPVYPGERGPASPWPELHGPKRDNLSPETGLLDRWPEGGPPLIWTYSECGKGYAAVSVAEGRLYTSGDFGEEERVIALDLEGRLLWRSTNGKAWRGASPGARCTPTYRDGAVYHMSPTGRLAAFDAKSGKSLWAVDLAERFGVEHGPWALSESLVVDGDRVLCTPGGEKGRIAALDRRSGKTLWANAEIRERAAYCSPIVVVRGGVRQMITLLRRSVVSVDVASGELLWSREHRTPYDLNVTMPLFHDGKVLLASGYGTGGRLIEIAPDGRSAKEIWSGGDLDNCHGGVLLLDGLLLGSGCRQSEKGFVCVDFLTGKTLWTDKEIWKVSLTYADGKLYGLGYEGKMMLIAADRKGARIVSAFQLPSEDPYDNLAHPVVFGGRLYLRQGGILYAYDVRAREGRAGRRSP